MSAGIFVIGVNHQLHSDEPLKLFLELSELLNVNLEVKAFFDYKSQQKIIKAYTVHCANAQKKAILYLPECNYFKAKYIRDHTLKKINWNSRHVKKVIVEALRKKSFYEYVCGSYQFEIFEQNMWLLSDQFPDYNYFFLEDMFREGMRANLPSDFDTMNVFRKEVMAECAKFGCEFALYFTLDYVGEIIADHLCDTKEELLDIILNKRYISEYLKNQPSDKYSEKEIKKRIENEAVSYVSQFFQGKCERHPKGKTTNVFIDDFKDLK